MGERKPPGVDFETWVDRQIRAATERGEFDDLPGAGKPLPGAGRPLDEMWWVRQKMREENLTFLPPVLALRKEAEQARAAALRADTDEEAREIITELNERISDAIRRPPPGPRLPLAPVNLDRVLRERAAARDER